MKAHLTLSNSFLEAHFPQKVKVWFLNSEILQGYLRDQDGTMQGHTHEQVLTLLAALQGYSRLRVPQILSFLNGVGFQGG